MAIDTILPCLCECVMKSNARKDLRQAPNDSMRETTHNFLLEKKISIPIEQKKIICWIYLSMAFTIQG